MKAMTKCSKAGLGAAALLLAALFSSCRKPDELPPLNEGYATEVILPEPLDLTPQDRALIEELEREYEEAVARGE